MLRVGEPGRPKDCRLDLGRWKDGVFGASSGSCPLKILPVACVFRRPLRIVTDAGIWLPRAEPLLGDPLGGVSMGAGSLDLALCTRSSKLCIFPRKLRS